MPLESPEKFERERVAIAGRPVTLTSWFDTRRQLWRANAPEMRILLENQSENRITGITRGGAIKNIIARLARLMTSPRLATA